MSDDTPVLVFRDPDRQKVDPRSPVQPDRGATAPILLVAFMAGIVIWTFQQYRIQDAGPGAKEREKNGTTSRSIPPSSPDSKLLTGLFSNDDYPAGALDRNEQGTVGVRVEINRRGRVAKCIVTESSGYDSLDGATCRIIDARARFAPAHDVNSDAVESAITQKITWRIAE